MHPELDDESRVRGESPPDLPLEPPPHLHGRHPLHRLELPLQELFPFQAEGDEVLLPAGTIVARELRPGYRVGKRVLRRAIVAAAPPPAPG